MSTERSSTGQSSTGRSSTERSSTGRREIEFEPPVIEFVPVPDLARIADVIQPLDADALHAILSLPGQTSELSRGLASALPASTIPAQSLVSAVTPAIGRSVLDWRDFAKVIDFSMPPLDRPVAREARNGFAEKVRQLVARARNKWA